jgi:hypothetical protein
MRLTGLYLADFLPLKISRISSLLDLEDFNEFLGGIPLSLVPFQLIKISKRAKNNGIIPIYSSPLLNGKTRY